MQICKPNLYRNIMAFMDSDKYLALWVSHSSITDFLSCPRLYYLKDVYKSPETGHKFQIVSPSLSLGQAVHDVVESLSVLPVEQRFAASLLEKFENSWAKVSGKKGGFQNPDTEERFKIRGQDMLRRVIKNPGPLLKLAVKINKDLPNYWLSAEDQIILCGKIDWLEYFPETDSVHILDFKTSKNKEKDDSLQLPIYYLLATYCQKRKVTGASYWYLETSAEPEEKKLPDLEKAEEDILKIARQIKIHRKLDRLKCKDGNGCNFCKPFERILNGGGELVGFDGRRDLYLLPDLNDSTESTIL